ncbi:MAG: hypothetical protein WAU50_03420 [Candidatus Sulfotelmatobacter sp.]
MATPIKDGAWLEWIAGLMGAASRQRHTAMLPPEKFHCLLDELPVHLIPQHSLDRRLQRLDTSQLLFLNPECLVLPAGVVPPELETHRELLEGFHLQRTVAWVRESGTGSLHPFWLGPRLAPLVSNLRRGEPVPASFPQAQQVLLAAAGILIPEDHAQRRHAEWSTIVNQRSQTFREKNYAPLGDLIHPFTLAALRRYYRHAIRRGAIWLGDEQSALRYVAHNEPVARYFHYQIAKAVAKIVGEPIKPSYVYLASYMSGAELKKHTDREQCEFSVTLCLDFSPEPALATPWPIRLDTSAGTVTAYQALGDGLVYRGTRVPHYRDGLARGYTSTSLFFHYVAANFSGRLN